MIIIGRPPGANGSFSHCLTMNSCILSLVLDSSQSVCFPRPMGYCSISKVSVFRQNTRLSGTFLFLKNFIITVPWSRASRICGISAELPNAMRAMLSGPADRGDLMLMIGCTESLAFIVTASRFTNSSERHP